MSELLAALGLAIVIEGLLYAAFPDQMKKMLAQVLTVPSAHMRLVALAVAAGGLVLLVLVRGF